MNCLTHKYTHVHMGSAKGLFKITSGSQSLPSRVINRLPPRQHSNVALNITAQLIFYVIESHLTTFLCTHRAHMRKHTWATPTHINRAQQPLQAKKPRKKTSEWRNEGTREKNCLQVDCLCESSQSEYNLKTASIYDSMLFDVGV